VSDDDVMPFIDTNALPSKELTPGWFARFFHSDNMTFAYAEIAAGSGVHSHRHAEEEVWHIVEGFVEMTLQEETQVVGAGAAVVVPSDVEHSARAVTSSRVIVVDYPVRELVAGVSTR
jgi:mannose-6-phosphate isomerase-like protein (cupin superfamily)